MHTNDTYRDHPQPPAIAADNVSVAVRRSDRTHSAGGHLAVGDVFVSRDGGRARLDVVLKSRAASVSLTLDRDDAKAVIDALLAVYPSLRV